MYVNGRNVLEVGHGGLDPPFLCIDNGQSQRKEVNDLVFFTAGHAQYQLLRHRVRDEGHTSEGVTTILWVRYDINGYQLL